jgi:hypothetical protein
MEANCPCSTNSGGAAAKVGPRRASTLCERSAGAINGISGDGIQFRVKHSLNQKDFNSATIHAAPVTRKVRAHSDQLKCAFG